MKIFLRLALAALSALIITAPAMAKEKQAIDQIDLGWKSSNHKAGLAEYDKGNFKQARQIISDACDDDSDMSACYVMAQFMQLGIGGPASKRSEKLLYGVICGEYGARAGNACLKAEGSGEALSPLGGNTGLLTRRKNRCAAGSLVDCNNVGATYGRGVGTPVDFNQAKTFYTKACNGGVGESCNNLALMSFNGEAGLKNDEAAREFAEMACNLDSVKGCANLSAYLYYGIGGDVDLPRSRKISDVACKFKSPEACNTFGQLTIRGRGGPKDYKAAALAFDFACREEIGLSCNNLAVMVLEGWGVPKNKAKALKIFARSCKFGYSKGCENETKLAKEIAAAAPKN